MRIIGGALGGRRLRSPVGMTTRPTADRVKEALFNILGPPPEGALALDLFAGSGALGLEALSRGIERVIFVDDDLAACKVLQDNLAHLSIAHRAQVRRQKVTAALHALASQASPASQASQVLGASLDRPFHWIFADPPYAKGELPAVLSQLGDPRKSRPLLTEETIVIVEHERRKRQEAPPADRYGALLRFDERAYGQTALSFYSLDAQPLDAHAPGSTAP